MKKNSILLAIGLLVASCGAVWAVTKTPAKDITVDTSAFNRNLSASDTDVQKALNTIDWITNLDTIWGDITGDINSQADLKAALDEKISGVNWNEIGGDQGDINLSGFTNDPGYLTSETDPVYSAWDKDYSDLTNTPDLSVYLTDAPSDGKTYGRKDANWSEVTTVEVDPIYSASSWFTTTNNADDWDTAYGWGDHATQGYLKSVNWPDIGGLQSDVNVSGFTNDAGYITSGDVPATGWTKTGTNVHLTTDTDNVGIGTSSPSGKLSISSPQITVDSVVYGSISATVGGDLQAYGYAYSFDVYAYKTVGTATVFSPVAYNLAFTDTGDESSYNLQLDWTAVSGATGYRIVIVQDDYSGIYGNGYFDVLTNSALYQTGVTVINDDTPDVTPKTDYDTTLKISGNAVISGISHSLAGSTAITGDVSLTGNQYVIGNVGINSTSPMATLDVDGSETVVTNIQRTSRFDFVRYRRAAGTWTDITAEAAISYGTVSGGILDATGDTFIVGKAEPFSKIYIDLGTAKSSGGTFVWEYSLGGDTWATLTVTDGTILTGVPLAQDGVVSFTPPGDWATDTQNSQGPYYFVRLRVTGGAFTTKPTVYLVVPNDGTDMFQVMANNGDTIPSLRVDRNGSVSIGFTTPQAYRFAVTGNTLLSGTLSGLTTISASSTITSSMAPNFTHVGGFLATGGSATALIPKQNSPVIRFTGQAWNGSATRTNAMDIYLNPDAEYVTNARMAFKNTTVDSIADASELMNLSTDGKLSVLGRAQQADDMFDRVFSYIGTTYTDLTLLVSSFGSTTGDVLDVVGNYVYIGKENKFSEMYFDFGTIMSSGTTRTWEYWNGSAWTALTVEDGTNNWQNDGSAIFTAPVDWATNTVNSVQGLYWVRIGTASGTFTVEPTLRILLPNTTAITKEVLSNNEFDGATNWATTGDYAYTTDDFTFTYSSGSGTLRQLAANFNSPLEANTWYRFRYTVGVAAPSTTLCWIGEEVATGKTYFSGSTTEVDVFFKTNSAPGDFVIYTTATATSGFRLDAVYLKKLENGNIYASGDVRVDGILRGNGTTGIKVDSTGNVGIGSLSPTEKLDVAGNIKASGTITGSNLSGTNTGDQDLSDYLQGTITSGYLPKSDGTKTFADSSIYDNGNVGIGTSVPGSKLEVKGDGMAKVIINSKPDGQGGCDAYSVLLSHFDADFNTTDCGGGSKTATLSANPPTISTSDKVFGDGSAQFVSASSQRMTYLDSLDWYFSTVNFTIDFRAKFATLPANGSFFAILSQYVDAANRQIVILYNNAGTYELRLYHTRASTDIIAFNSAVSISTDTWYHFAIVRNGTTFRAYLNGSQVGTDYTSSTGFNNFAAVMEVGSTNNSSFMNGKIDELRISNGIARWTGTSFAVPGAPYDASVMTSNPELSLQADGTEKWDLKSDGADSDKFKIGNGSDRLVIDGNGNIGVGTTAPLARLDTVGLGTTSATSNVILRNAVKTPIVTVLDNGNVGIGTAVPLYKLEVNGTLQADAFHSSDGTAGFTGTCADGTALTVKNGLITGCS